MKGKTCCFFGHREIEESDCLRNAVRKTVENLVLEQGVDRFLFGSRSRFDRLCHEIVTEIKKQHPNIKRVYVRAEYEQINEDYEAYLLKDYEETYFSQKAKGAGRAVYIKRNYEMIENSDFCVVYFDESRTSDTKSGTKIALDYAKKYGKRIILIKHPRSASLGC